MRVWSFSEMAYHPAWKEDCSAARCGSCCPQQYDPQIATSC